jgi:FtsP/CotA-like multicopper oxidase with cupredoxin domain
MAVIGNFTTLALSSPAASIAVDLTFNRIAQYTLYLVNLQNNSSVTRTYTAQTIPITLSPNLIVEGIPGDTVELTVTNNLTSEVDTAQYVIESIFTVTVSRAGGCGSTISLAGSTTPDRTFTVTITPNPGAGQSVTLQDIKDGSPVFTLTRNTDANGEITQPIIIQTADIGSEKGLRASYQGADDSCTVQVIA